MREIPIEVEVTAEQGWGRGIDQVEQRHRGDEHGEDAGSGTRRDHLRARRARDRDKEQQEGELRGGTPLDSQTVRNGISRRDEQQNQQQHAENRPGKAIRRAAKSWELSSDWRHRKARVMSSRAYAMTGNWASMRRFEGTDTYVATQDLRIAVNAAIALERPLLVKGEPGTGKTILAHEVARGIARNLITWHIKSTTKAQQGLYEYDAVSRLRDGQLGDERVHDIANYIVPGKLWEAFEAAQAPVLLIDEIDKADIEFPNDLLLELDRMEFYVYETRRTIQARHRPIVIITSNNEKELPDAFLRRCFFHYIRFPDRETMQQIIDVHFPDLKHELVHEALTIFYDIRQAPGLKKKPSTSELLDWIKLLLVEDISPEVLRTRDPAKLIPPLHGALLKNEEDVHLFERLAFLHRRERGGS